MMTTLVGIAIEATWIVTLWSANSWIRERKHLSKTEWAIVIAIGYAVALLRAKWILFRS